MREIKFRAWDEKDGGMSNVFCLDDLYQAGFMQLILNHKEENYRIMQYTGLKDKNGKEIYEGDIIESTLDEKKFGVVKFGKGRFYLDFGKTQMTFMNENRSKLKIIGNKYENPELLDK